MSYAGFAPQPLVPPQQAIPTPQFTPSQSSNIQNSRNASSFTSQQTFTQVRTTHGPPYQRRPSYDAAYGTPAAQSTTPYASIVPPQQSATLAPPPMMGPPMRWGFENAGSVAGEYTAAQHGNQRGPRPFGAYGSKASVGSTSVQHANKRDHTSAFGMPRSIGPRVPAPPPVPSFGNPLPSKPPPPVDATKKPNKKKRKHNQLGLTPKTEEHESSEEEEDVDDEARLALGGAGAAAPLQFTYKGRTATLRTPEEIASWIEERKKRFPTQARIAEKKKAMEKVKKAREEAQRQMESQKQEARRLQKNNPGQKGQAETANPVDAAARAKQKADRLRRKLLKEQKRVEKAEADAERAQMRVEELQKGQVDVSTVITPEDDQPQPEAQSNLDTTTRTAQELQDQPLESGNIANGGAETANGAIPMPISGIEPSHEHMSEAAVSSSDSSNSSDWTSSSGSDVSSSGSDDSDDDSTPEEATSRREGPERVAPPAREAKKRCKFLHQAPQRRAKAKPVEKKGRKGLLQALLDRQKEDNDRRAMEVIMWLGENGYLEPPQQNKEDASEKSGDAKVTQDTNESQRLSKKAMSEQATMSTAQQVAAMHNFNVCLSQDRGDEFVLTVTGY
ncbi:CCCH zinc finger protein [Aspergillus tanneri]|uniref:FMR1-interacting protein 1 conserved domain-containing protein n=1 Tax=Aspergillus tanneri TaxID=1220188 RepID=A0A5M9MH10_9EURO|nr:uncharacterized protein ATNIH1004_011168 [Aspergillus tanneri]KAA8642227.1 hypothetical protein ATNIH1004_011168 [Aspergillus tanneri]